MLFYKYISNLISITFQFAVYNNVIILKKLNLKLKFIFLALNKYKNIRTEGYSKHQTSNCDETRLYLIMLPGHTLALVHNRQDETKKKQKAHQKVFHNLYGSVSFILINKQESYAKQISVLSFFRKSSDINLTVDDVICFR